jgi:deoxyribodipyrimidine photo-lyase
VTTSRNTAGRAVIHWLRNDLRLTDNAALSAAVDSGLPVLPVYVLDDGVAGTWKAGGASRWWLHHSLASLDADLRRRGSRLIVRRGSTLDHLRDVARQSGAGAVFASRAYEPWAVGLETDVRDGLAADGIALRRFGGALLVEPEAVRTKGGTPFSVFTPFWRAVLAGPVPRAPRPAPTALAAPGRWPASLRLGDLGLLPTKPDWSGGIAAAWRPGEAGARARLDRFVSEALPGYGTLRDRPDLEATSRLSPHLHFGEISPASCWHGASAAAAAQGSGAAGGLEVFLKELGWREFSYHLLTQRPDLPEEPFKATFKAFPWRDDPRLQSAWRRGRTGYPIVDAGMRELWATGWMHNRVRMIVASFLIKHLLQPWQVGEAWFWDTLVDADLASNAASWQWVAGSGADAAPYFRIFNPIAQGEKFDPEGGYVRRWVPELAGLGREHLHAPWQAPAEALAAAGVVLGKTYPQPVVDHMAARERALAAYAQISATGASS